MVKMTEANKNLVKSIFAQYTKVDKYPNIITERTVIHIYPTHDTYDEEGELRGFSDCLFSIYRFYFTESKTYYEFINKDGIDFEGMRMIRVRVFKDNSTMIILSQQYTINNFQCLCIEAI